MSIKLRIIAYGLNSGEGRGEGGRGLLFFDESAVAS